MRHKVVLRKAVLDDISCILGIEEKSFLTDQLSAKQIRYLVSSQTARTWVATVDKQVVAYGVFLLKKHIAAARLYSLAVSPDYQRRGIAKKLIEQGVNYLTSQGYYACFLEVRASHSHSQALYNKLGFAVVKTLPAYYQDGEAALGMKLRLPLSRGYLFLRSRLIRKLVNQSFRIKCSN